MSNEQSKIQQSYLCYLLFTKKGQIYPFFAKKQPKLGSGHPKIGVGYPNVGSDYLTLVNERPKFGLKLERDVKALIHGKADGEVVIKNEKPELCSLLFAL